MNINRATEIIDELKSLDLKTYPYEQAKALIEELFNFHTMLFVIPKGTKVLRARLNEPNKRYKEVKDLSYKPQEYNDKYQRASTPYQTAFYAGALPAKKFHQDIRLISTFEVSPLVRKIISKDYSEYSNEVQIEAITYGKWETIKDLPLIALCYHEQFINKHHLTESLYEKYINSLNSLSSEQKEISIFVNNYFALEFAKDKITDHSDYLISALFTEIAIKNGHRGVLYPSIRCEGDGFNLAIAPQYVFNYLRLVAVGESKIFYKGKDCIINNKSFSIINPGQKKFTLNSLKGTKHYKDEKLIFEFLNRTN